MDAASLLLLYLALDSVRQCSCVRDVWRLEFYWINSLEVHECNNTIQELIGTQILNDSLKIFQQLHNLNWPKYCVSQHLLISQVRRKLFQLVAVMDTNFHLVRVKWGEHPWQKWFVTAVGVGIPIVKFLNRMGLMTLPSPFPPSPWFLPRYF